MASGSRTARYHGDGHQLSSSGSRHRGNWHDEYSPLWSEYLLKEKHKHEKFEMTHNCIRQLWCMTLPRLSNIFWMLLSLASTITRLSSNIRTFMDSHLEDIHSGWSTKHKTVMKTTVLYVQYVWNKNYKNLGLTIRNQWCWWFHNCPTSLFEHFNLAGKPKSKDCYSLTLNATQCKQASATLT